MGWIGAGGLEVVEADQVHVARPGFFLDRRGRLRGLRAAKAAPNAQASTNNPEPLSA
jgi:hypothetical protein